MKKTMTICGEVFEYCGNKGSIFPVMYDSTKDSATLDDAYGHYSKAKENIYRKWADWYRECVDSGISEGGIFSDMWISSHNTQTFTLEGYLRMIDPETGALEYYDIKITKAHNRIWKCEW